jgi:1-pyrroline-4-hydroxy-2-carboxylate deaminase
VADRTLRFAKVYTATTTPFTADGAVDLDAYAEHCAWQVDQGVGGIVPNGSLGEYEALEPDERAALVEVAVEAVGDRAEVIAGASGPSSPAACRWVEHAAKAGATAVMVLPPTSHRPTVPEVLAHYRDVASVGLPVIAYNNPFSTRVDLVPEVLAELSAVDGVAGVKEFSQDVRRVARIRALAPHLEVLCGCDDLLVESMLMGATGWIAGFVNAFPAQSVHLHERCLAGDYAAAVALYTRMLPILAWDADPRFVQAIKLGQEEAGRYGGPVRPPRLPLPEDEAAVVRAAARAALQAGS